MAVSCSCGDGDGDFWWIQPEDFTVYPFRRGRKCSSCGDMIRNGDECVEVQNFRSPETDIEASIYGEDGEIQKASRWMCERCGGLFLSMLGLGFCFLFSPNPRERDDMREAVKEVSEIQRQTRFDAWVESLGGKWEHLPREKLDVAVVDWPTPERYCVGGEWCFFVDRTRVNDGEVVLVQFSDDRTRALDARWVPRYGQPDRLLLVDPSTHLAWRGAGFLEERP